MENYFDLLARDIKKLWGGLDLSKRVLIIFLSLAAVAAISFIIVKSTEPEWGVLYSDLSETDSLAIIENLKDSGYPYKLSDDRSTVLVPIRLKEELRVMVAENDVIKDSNPGFELLSKMQFGATEFQNKLTKQRIYQDELTRTIERIRGVKKVRVQLAEPDRSVFSNRDELPTASVMLILDAGTRLKPDQVKAIKNLVAYGVARLKPENVFVTDQNGISLADKLVDNSAGLIDYRQEFETKTAAKVQKVLQRLVGLDNVSVEVSADINFDRTKKTVEKYLPAEGGDGITGILESERQELETYGKKDGETSAEIELEEEESPGKKGKTDYQKTRNSRDYKVSKEIEQVVYAPGKVRRMTIAVALNKILTSNQKEEIKELVASASGADLARGDIITVTGMQFAPLPEDTSTPILKQIERVSNLEFIISQVGPLVVILVLGLGALYVLSSLLKKPIQGEVYSSGGSYYDEYGDEHSESPDLLETSVSVPAIEASLDPETEKMKGEINATINNDPSEAARLLLSYIKD